MITRFAWWMVPALLPFLALMLWALIDVIRRPADKMRYLPKWGWVLIVLFGETLGQIVYLVVGRDTTPTAAPTAGSDVAHARDIADALYGGSGSGAPSGSGGASGSGADPAGKGR